MIMVITHTTFVPASLTAAAPTYVAVNTISEIQRRKDSLSLNC